MAKKQITKSGFEKLERELEELISVKRVEVAQKLKEARAFGDLSENAEYDEAKNEQAILEARIQELEYMRDNVEIIEVTEDSLAMVTEVLMGSLFEIKDEDTGKNSKWQIVGTNEVNVIEGKISDESPIGSAAMRKKVGDVFLVATPKGEKRYQVMSISR